MIPLPLAFGAPLLSAKIRTTPEDFQVDELPAFEPSGEGEHLLLTIRKRGHEQYLEVLREIGRASCRERV